MSNKLNLLNSIKGVFFTFVIVALFSCTSAYQSKPVAHGSAGEILVVMNNDIWNSEAGDTLKAIFHSYCPGIPFEEYIFNLHQIPKNKFIEQNLYHRNVIFQEIDPKAEGVEIQIIEGKYAEKQVYVNIVAPDQASFVRKVSQQREALVDLFLSADRNRWVNMLKKHYDTNISDRVGKNFGISINIPLSYNLDMMHEDFAWISKEMREYSMALLVYTYPITDSSLFAQEYLISERNKMLKKYVEGSREGSYMTTETKFDYPQLDIIQHNNRETAVLRGMWKVEGDFMGGPFVSYTKKDASRNRYVCVEAYVYYPNNEVRDKIRELEGAVYTYDLEK